MARGQAKSNIKSKGRQPPVPKDQGEVFESPHCVFELTVCREAVSKHQEASRHSQKHTFAGNRKPSQAIHSQKHSYPGNTDISLASNKQCPHRQESMVFPCLSCHCKLTWSRYYNIHTSSIVLLRPPRNGNRSKTSDIAFLKSEISLFRSDYEYRLRTVLLKKNYIKRRRLTSAKTILIFLSIGFWLKIDVRNISNKTIKSKTTSKEINLRKNLNKNIDYRNIISKSHTNQCTTFILCNISLRRRNFHLLFVARIRNHQFKHSTINCHEKSKTFNTKIQIIKFVWKKKKLQTKVRFKRYKYEQNFLSNFIEKRTKKFAKYIISWWLIRRNLRIYTKKKWNYYCSKYLHTHLFICSNFKKNLTQNILIIFMKMSTKIEIT